MQSRGKRAVAATNSETKTEIVTERMTAAQQYCISTTFVDNLSEKLYWIAVVIKKPEKAQQVSKSIAGQYRSLLHHSCTWLKALVALKGPGMVEKRSSQKKRNSRDPVH